MAKSIQLDPSRNNLKPRPSGLTDDQYLVVALKEGYKLLEEEAKTNIKPSVTSPTSPAPSKVQDALAAKSDNPYVKAREQVLNKMLPSARSVILKMEDGTILKDHRWTVFCRSVSELGDKLSSQK